MDKFTINTITFDCDFANSIKPNFQSRSDSRVSNVCSYVMPFQNQAPKSSIIKSLDHVELWVLNGFD